MSNRVRYFSQSPFDRASMLSVWSSWGSLFALRCPLYECFRICDGPRSTPLRSNIPFSRLMSALNPAEATASCHPGVSWVHETEGTPSEGCASEREAVPPRGSQGTPGSTRPGEGTSLERGPRGVYLLHSILRAMGQQARVWHSITTS